MKLEWLGSLTNSWKQGERMGYFFFCLCHYQWWLWRCGCLEARWEFALLSAVVFLLCQHMYLPVSRRTKLNVLWEQRECSKWWPFLHDSFEALSALWNYTFFHSAPFFTDSVFMLCSSIRSWEWAGSVLLVVLIPICWLCNWNIFWQWIWRAPAH